MTFVVDRAVEQQPIVVDLDDEFHARLCEMAAEANRTPGDFLGDLIEGEMRKWREQREGEAKLGANPIRT